MKSGKTLQEMAVELERQKNAKRDFVAPTKELKLQTIEDVLGGIASDPVSLKVNGHGDFRVNKIAHGQIASRVGIPQKYYDRMKTEAPELLVRNVNHWFEKKPENRMVRTLDGSARAFLSSRYRTIDNLPIAENAIDTLTKIGGLKVESAELTDSRMYIKAVTERISFEVKKGDVVQAGIVISNSEVGMGSVKVEPLVYRVVCSNGMIANDYSMRKYHIGRGIEADIAEELYADDTRRTDDRAFMLKVRDVIQNAFRRDVFQRIAEKMTETTGRKIEGDPVKAVEVTQKKLGLQDSERSSVLTHLIQGGDLTQWGLLNAVTRTAEDVKDYDRATEMEKLGGVVLELPKTDWQEIATAA